MTFPRETYPNFLPNFRSLYMTSTPIPYLRGPGLLQSATERPVARYRSETVEGLHIEPGLWPAAGN